MTRSETVREASIWVIVAVTGLVYFAGFWWFDEPAGNVLTRLSGFAVLSVSVVLYAFDNYLWRLQIVNRFVKRPVLFGTWKGTFESDYVYPATGKKEAPTEAYFAVRQTFSKVHLRFITGRSTSESKACELKIKDDGRYEIYAVYENRPPSLAQEASRVHLGGLVLDIVGDPAHALHGSYWSDRKTKGDLRLDRRSEMIYDDFESATGGSFT